MSKKTANAANLTSTSTALLDAPDSMPDTLADGLESMAEATTDTPAPVAETPKKVVTKVTPVEDRFYASTTYPATGFKGKQRQIVAAVLQAFTEDPGSATIADITPIARKAGLIAKGGVMPSVRYHLHHMVLLGYAVVTNPTYEVSE